MADGFNETTATPAQLKACGLFRAAISGSTPMAGGGRMYEYKTPYGEILYVPTTPVGGVQTADLTSREKIDYGINVGGEQVNTHGVIAKIRIPAQWKTITHPPKYMYGNLNATAEDATAESGTPKSAFQVKNYGWAGWANTATGWTQAIAEYTEPPTGMSSCINKHDGVFFWSGIGGIGDDDIGQTGTVINDGGWPNGAAWFETDSSQKSAPAQYPNKPVAKPGDFVTAETQWDGGKYMFTLWINKQKYTVGESGNWATDDATAEEVVEPFGKGFVPDFGDLLMTGYNGRGEFELQKNPLIKLGSSQLDTGSIDDLGGFDVIPDDTCD